MCDNHHSKTVNIQTEGQLAISDVLLREVSQVAVGTHIQSDGAVLIGGIRTEMSQPKVRQLGLQGVIQEYVSTVQRSHKDTVSTSEHYVCYQNTCCSMFTFLLYVAYFTFLQG